MYHKILVAYDGSPDSCTALNQVADLGSSRSAIIVLLAVIDSLAIMLPVEGMCFANETQEAETQSFLNRGLVELRKLGLRGEALIRYGNPAEQIAISARETGADLVVVGHRDQGAVARWLNGSVGISVINHAPCSVLVAVQSRKVHRHSYL